MTDQPSLFSAPVARGRYRVTTEPRLTAEILREAWAALEKQKNPPRHSCSLDGHVLHFNYFGFARCMYCGACEADIARPGGAA